MSNKTIQEIIKETKEFIVPLIEQGVLGKATENKLVLTEENLQKQLSCQSDNGHDEANIFYLSVLKHGIDEEGVPSSDLKIESVWVNKETLEAVEVPEWEKKRISESR